jgi:heme/copper-type cytochrome/quinol oxidase subunit 3
MINKTFSLILALVFILSFSFISAETNLYPPVKQNECVDVKQTCGTCTYMNVTISYPNSTIAILNKVMTNKGGGIWNYTFCNTSTFGEYNVNTCGDINSIFQCSIDGTLSFIVNGSGQNINSSQINLIIINIIILLISGTFFFIMALIFQHPGTKIFLMALASLTLIFLIGMITGNASIYLAEFPNLINMYNSYYILIVTLSGVAMLGIIIWLIYWSLTTFNKIRGRSVDD